MVHGIVLIDKPVGLTSNQVLQKVRRLYGKAKGGHTGALDPFATGMLPICLGEATKISSWLLDAGKSYLATCLLGSTTDSADCDGEVTGQCPVPDDIISAFEACRPSFLGEQQQLPPMYSAVHHKGKRLYELARQGKEVERTPRAIHIHDIEFAGMQGQQLSFHVSCSKGTYIRVLAEDMAKAMGSCGHLVALRRTAVSPFENYPMVSIEELEQIDAEQRLEYLLAVDLPLQYLPAVHFDSFASERVRHGNRQPGHDDVPDGLVRMYDDKGCFLGIGECREDGQVQPKKLFNLKEQDLPD